MTVYENEWQFLRSASAPIVAIAERYDHDKEEWQKKCEQFQRKHHVELIMSNEITGSISAVGVSASKGTGDLPGQWCKPDNGIIRPYSSNQLMRRYFKPLSLIMPDLPGIDRLVVVETPGSDGFFCGTTFFVQEHQVWAKAGASAEFTNGLWQPILEWQYRQAKERRKAARKAQKHV